MLDCLICWVTWLFVWWFVCFGFDIYQHVCDGGILGWCVCLTALWWGWFVWSLNIRVMRVVDYACCDTCFFVWWLVLFVLLLKFTVMCLFVELVGFVMFVHLLLCVIVGFMVRCWIVECLGYVFVGWMCWLFNARVMCCIV